MNDLNSGVVLGGAVVAQREPNRELVHFQVLPIRFPTVRWLDVSAADGYADMRYNDHLFAITEFLALLK